MIKLKICAIALMLVGAYAASATDAASQPLPSVQLKPAQFRITAEAATGPVEPFTATIGNFGNSLIWNGGAFEPLVYRNRFTAIENSPDRVVVAPEALSRNDTLREGFFDGAEVWIYRIDGGQFRLIRNDSVVQGGSAMSGWGRVLRERHVVPPNTTNFTFRWDETSRPGVPSYFCVRAVDSTGRVSAPSRPVSATWSGSKAEAQARANVIELAKGVTNAESAALAVPSNIRSRILPDGSLSLEWDPVKGTDVAGYAIYRSDYPPDQHRGYFLELKNRAVSADQQVRTGDMVIVSKRWQSTSRLKLLSNRAWGSNREFRDLLPGLVSYFPDEDASKSWELVRHDASTPVADPGETFLRMRLSAGTSESLSVFNHAGTAQSHFDVLEPVRYRAEFWMRHEGSGTARFSLTGYYSTGPHRIAPAEFRPGREWRRHTVEFTPEAIHTGRQAGQMQLELTGPGVFDIDNFRVYRVDAPYLQFDAREAAALKAGGFQTLRAHGTIKTGTRTYDMAQFTNPGGVIDAIRKGNTLPQILASFRSQGVYPWLQVEYHMSPGEWLGLIEYLAAPYVPGQDTPGTKPWAHKRVLQGQVAPWSTEFDRLYLELSNETWNRLFRPWIFEPMQDARTGKNYSAGEVYGLYQEFVIATLRSSPYWKASGLDRKLKFVLGGRAADVRYGRDAAAMSPSADFATIGTYIGGWDEAEGAPTLSRSTLFYLLNHVNQSGVPVADELVRALRETPSTRGRGAAPGTYEAGPGYALHGLNNARVTPEQSREQELVMKSLAAGTATLDAFLARAARGFQLQSFFTFGSGPLWKSHMFWHEGGKPHPSWQLLSLFNREATGEMLRVHTLSVPTAHLEPAGRRRAARDAPLVAVYASRRGERYSVFLLSRRVADYPGTGDAGYTPVTLELPFDHASSVSLFRLAGAAEASLPRGDDPRIELVKISSDRPLRRFPVDATTGADPRGLPPAATLLYVFDGVRQR